MINPNKLLLREREKEKRRPLARKKVVAAMENTNPSVSTTESIKGKKKKIGYQTREREEIVFCFFPFNINAARGSNGFSLALPENLVALPQKDPI